MDTIFIAYGSYPFYKHLSGTAPDTEGTMQGEPIIVVVQGGCVTDVLGVQSYDVFDWDNFEDDPIAYWDDRGSSGSEYWQSIEDYSPELYAEVEAKVQKAQQKQLEQLHSDPFWMVEAR